MSESGASSLQLNKLLKLFSGSFIIRISYTFFGFVNSVLLARFLGAEQYGVYVFALSIVALLSIPTQFGMPILVVREFAAFHTKQKWALMKGLAIRSHQFVFVVATFICCCAALWLWVNPLGYPSGKQQALWVSLLLVPIMSFGALRDAMLRGLRHVILAQLPESFIRPLLLMLGLLFVIFAMQMKAAVSEILLYYVVCSLVSFAIGWLFFNHRKPKKLSTAKAEYKSRLWFSAALPIGLTGGMQVLNMQLSTVLLGFYSSDEEVAFYRVAALAAGFVVIVLQVVNSVVAPYFSRLYAQGDMRGIETLVAKTNKIIVLTTVPIVTCIALASPWVLKTFYGEAFSAAYIPLLLLTAGQAVNALMGSVGLLLNMTGHQRDVTKTMLIALVINILLHALLLPHFGLYGAAFSSMVMLITWNLLLWVKVKQRLGIKYYV